LYPRKSKLFVDQGGFDANACTVLNLRPRRLISKKVTKGIEKQGSKSLLVGVSPKHRDFLGPTKYELWTDFQNVPSSGFLKALF
jgi:hypothetical protein